MSDQFVITVQVLRSGKELLSTTWQQPYIYPLDTDVAGMMINQIIEQYDDLEKGNKDE